MDSDSRSAGATVDLKCGVPTSVGADGCNTSVHGCRFRCRGHPVHGCGQTAVAGTPRKIFFDFQVEAP